MPVQDGWEPLLGALGIPRAPVAAVRQVHGDSVVPVVMLPVANPLASADALITALPGVVLTVRTADCVPILLAAPGGVAAVHAGWRGTSLDIVGLAARALQDLLGCPPGAMGAVIGPCIHACCYEVGGELVDAVSVHVPVPVFVRPRGEQVQADLVAANRFLLERAGVGAVEAVGRCTRCASDEQGFLYHSYRRDGAGAGRQVAAIALVG